MHPSNRVTKDNLEEICWYHKPTQEQAGRHQNLSEALSDFITAILENCPDCADRSAAIRSAREAKMMASSAIALEPAEIAFK